MVAKNKHNRRAVRRLFCPIRKAIPTVSAALPQGGRPFENTVSAQAGSGFGFFRRPLSNVRQVV
ncbi:flp pilus assembly protein ATPase CpaF [Neisseria bacilliformis ATCC BAA-1200]|uniref:Flp pilus assembly protein ATPase CpaF n=1 Tax=Neisseria bacilliformis ATCC BAA-1200 TaxID=888742 RepID=F2BA26_9NEIS|nr:flp pilus assembly protein ATPase CpaF [Neisseria bacilliformis ATCC BAA-1200]